MSACTLGIDLGTSAVKVLALSEAGDVLAKARRSYPTHVPATNWAEQNPAEWWNATTLAISDVVVALAGTPIAAIGLSGQLNGFVLADEAGAPLHFAPIWLDLRAGGETAELQARLGEEIEAVTGNRLSPISVLSKLVWMQRHRPELVAKARKLFLVKDYLLWRLVGVHATDPSDASAINLMSLADRSWSERICAAAGIDPRILPKILPSAAIAGHVHGRAAQETGLREGTPVAPGGGDVMALSVGCGVIADGVLGGTLGTAGHVVLPSSKILNAAPGLWQIAHAPAGRVIWLGLVMSGGLSLSWLHRTMSLGPAPLSFNAFAGLADEVEPGARGLAFLPFLEGAATPYDRPQARAVFDGLTSSHGAAELVRAVMEGVACNIRECVELFEQHGGRVDEIRLAEGGSRIPRWCQIIADVLGRPLALIEETDASALGAAIIAQAATTEGPLHAVALKGVRLGRVLRPDPGAGAAYDGAFRRYKEVAARHVRVEQ